MISTEWLDNNILVGFTSKRSDSWTDKKGTNNHYEGPVPAQEVKDRLFAWNPVKVPLEYKVDGIPFISQSRCVIARSDSGADLGVFKAGYKPLGFRDWVSSLEQDTLGDELFIGSAGVLRDGAAGWVSIELPDNVTTPEGVEFRPNLLASTSLDGSVATSIKRVVTEVQCGNLFSAGSDVARVRHTRKSHERIPSIQGAVHMVHAVAYDFSKTVRDMCAHPITPVAFDRVLDRVAPVPPGQGLKTALAEAKREKLRTLWEADDRVSPWRGTAYGVWQMVSTYNQHEGIIRGANRVERNMLNVLGFVTESSDKWIKKMVMDI